MKAEVRERAVQVVTQSIQKVVVLEIPWDEAQQALNPLTTLNPFVQDVIEATRVALTPDHIWSEPFERKPLSWYPRSVNIVRRCVRCGLEVHAGVAYSSTGMRCPGRSK